MGHLSSQEKMYELLDKYVTPDQTRQVLELGSYVIQDGYPPEQRYPPETKHGGYRSSIVPHKGIYRGVDIQAGMNVDIVIEDPYHWPVEDGTIGLVFSAQCLEHVEDLKAFMAECFRVLAPGGLTIHIAPSTGPYHAFPIHAWMIMKDGMDWLLRVSGFEVLEADHWTRHPWDDCWGVGRKPST